MGVDERWSTSAKGRMRVPFVHDFLSEYERFVKVVVYESIIQLEVHF